MVIIRNLCALFSMNWNASKLDFSISQQVFSLNIYSLIEVNRKSSQFFLQIHPNINYYVNWQVLHRALIYREIVLYSFHCRRVLNLSIHSAEVTFPLAIITQKIKIKKRKEKRTFMAKMHNFFLLTCLIVIIPTLHANVKEDEIYWKRQSQILNDSYWKQKASVAEKENKQAYTSDPYSLTKNLTFSVSEWVL